nr:MULTISPECIES: PAS domain-containing sensor histidine kinase [unclassified Desertifilum]
MVGLALLVGYRVWLELKLKNLLPDLKSDTLRATRSSLSRLLWAIAFQQETCRDLENQVERWKQLLYLAPIGYIQVDEENQLCWCNQQACQLLGIQAPAAARPRLLLEIVRSYELDELIEVTRDAQKPCQREWTFQPTCADPTNLSQQQAIALRGIGIPLTRGEVGVFLENCQEVLILSQQRDRAFSDVAHELKTPLTSIRLVAETLQSRLDPPLRNWVDRLLNEAIRLSDLVQVLLDLSQLEREAGSCLNLKNVNLPELIQSSWLSLEPLARKKQVELDYGGPSKLLIQADEPRLYRVLLNLLDNSIKYSPSGASIQLRVSLEPHPQAPPESTQQWVHLEAIDSGSGFPENAIPHVFERFYRAEPSRSRRYPHPSASSRPDNRSPASDLHPSYGSGLGLAIVRQIIEAHRGTVSASNHPDTGGAWLQVWLPWQPSNLTIDR